MNAGPAAGTWFDAGPSGWSEAFAVLGAIPLDQWSVLGVAGALLLLYALSARASRLRVRRLARADVAAAEPDVVAAARAVGFEGYAISWSSRGTGVVLTLWGSSGRYVARGRGRLRREAVLAALSAILAVVPAPYEDEAEAGYFDAYAQAASDAAREAGAKAGKARRESAAAPAPDWWRVELGLGPDATRAEADRAWRTLAKTAHPDHGGSADRMALLNAARDEARRVLGQGGLASGRV